MSKVPSYLKRKLLYLVPQLFGVVLIAFVIVRAVPGDPARILSGPLMSEEGVQLIRQRMGLGEPLPIQFIYYLRDVIQGNLGFSWFTGNPVTTDIAIRLPATLELVGLSLLFSVLVLVPIGIKAASATKGPMKVVQKILFGYGMAAGAFPDFWLALILVLVFCALLGWAPSPTGQLDIGLAPPTRITGSYLFDSIFTANWEVFKSHGARLIMPVFVLAFVYGGGILKVAIVAVGQFRGAQFVNFAKVSGVPPSVTERYISRASYPAIATMTGVMFGFLIGGAVLVEKVFSWNGMGQYVVQAVINTDYAAVQGVVLVAAILNLFVYILVDMVYLWVDPRIKTLG